MPNGYTVTVWVEAPEGWNPERVREEVDQQFRIAGQEAERAFSKGEADKVDTLTLNTVYTPKVDGYNDDGGGTPVTDPCPIEGHGDHNANETH